MVLPRPGYAAYRNMLVALGCRVLDLALDESFAVTVDQLESLPERPAGLVLASPANPTGTMVDAQRLAAIVTWCERRGVRLVSDEIYHGITYDDAAVTGRFPTQSRASSVDFKGAATAWATSRNAVVINSFSKYFSMTGWRLGWMLCPSDLRDAVDRLAGNFALCPPTLAQHAAVAAFDSYDELDENVARYAINRDLLLGRLPEMGMSRLAPVDGAFYVYADVGDWTDDSVTFASRLLTETGVAVGPGVDFDPVDGSRFIRMCFAGDTAEIEQAMDKLGGLAAPTRVVRSDGVRAAGAAYGSAAARRCFSRAPISCIETSRAPSATASRRTWAGRS